MGHRRDDCYRLLTREEETALSRLKPLVIRHLDLILETVVLHLGSEPEAALLLQDAVAVTRFKESQREYLLGLLDGSGHKRSAVGGAEDPGARHPLELSPRWHLRMLAQVVTALQPLIQEAFESRPALHRTIGNALLKVVFYDIERLTAAPVEPSKECLPAGNRSAKKVKASLDCGLSNATGEQESVSRQWKVMEELMLSHTMMCDLARKMNAPLNLMLNSAEEILNYSNEPKVQRGVMAIVRQVEVMIHLREPLRVLGERLVSRWDAANDSLDAADVTLSESPGWGNANLGLEDGD
jgi:hypothetical protein